MVLEIGHTSKSLPGGVKFNLKKPKKSPKLPRNPVLGFIGFYWVFIGYFIGNLKKSYKSLLSHCNVTLVDFKSYFSPCKICLGWFFWLKWKFQMLQIRVRTGWNPICVRTGWNPNEKVKKICWPQIIRNVEKSTLISKPFF